METLRKVLVPVDFSPASAEAAQYAAEIARELQAELCLLHVAPPIHLEYSMVQLDSQRSAEMVSHRHQTLRHTFDLFLSQQEESENHVRREIVEGDAAEEIIRRAHDGRFDLIVMPTHGRSPLRRWLTIGSVTSKVLHGAECPVLAATNFSKHYNPRQIGRIVSAIDLGPQTAHVLRWSAALAKRYGVPLSVVHAMPDFGTASEDWRSSLHSSLREKIETLMGESKVQGSIVIEPGDPHKVVSKVATDLGAGVVVIGRGASSDLLGRLRAQAYEIIRRSPCPVLSV